MSDADRAAAAAAATEQRDRLDPFYDDDFADDGFAPLPAHDGPRDDKASLAYSAVRPDADADRDIPTEAVLEEPVRPSEVATRRTPSRGDRSRSATEPRRRMNRMAVWALVLSMIGITAPVGIALGYKALVDIRRSREEGSPYALAAIVIGSLYVFVFIIGLCVYWWIRSGT